MHHSSSVPSARRACWLCGVLLASFFAVASPLSAARMLVIGDSLSVPFRLAPDEGWVALLAAELAPRHEVLNYSAVGKASYVAADGIDRVISSAAPNLILIILGGNDGLSRIAPGVTRRSLASIVRAGIDSGADVILMQIRLPESVGSEFKAEFERVYADVASEYGIRLVPFFLDAVYRQPGMIMDDGIHPTAPAQVILYQEMLTVVRETLDSY